MSQEKYLQIKKEYRIRLALVIFLFILFVILDCMLIVSSSRFIPLLATAMASVIPVNHFLLVPFWQQKKAMEEEHPEWKELSTKGVKVPAAEVSKRTLAGIGATLALLLSFAIFYRLVEQQKINYKELNDALKINEATSTSSTSSMSNLSTAIEESAQTESSSSDNSNSHYHIPGADDETIKKVVDKSLQDLRQQNSGEQQAE
jgi:hypothetical protein